VHARELAFSAVEPDSYRSRRAPPERLFTFPANDATKIFSIRLYIPGSQTAAALLLIPPVSPFIPNHNDLNIL